MSLQPATMSPAVGIRLMVQGHDPAVAIVDDDQAVLDSLKFLLKAAGHTVATYLSAAAFLTDRVTRYAGLILDHLCRR